MIYTRLDNGCKAKVLAANDKQVLITAVWPAKQTDPHFDRDLKMARNTLNVSREYFDSNYKPSN